MFAALVGAALLGGTRLLWIVLAVWFPFALLVIRLEEKELVIRFGASYEAYRTRVPGFLPFK
jgi:protein-S-isoprenylcysteine O-methyltransferase Ste14